MIMGRRPVVFWIGASAHADFFLNHAVVGFLLAAEAVDGL